MKVHKREEEMEKKEEGVKIPFATYDVEKEKKEKSREYEPGKKVDVFKKEKGEIVIPLKPIRLNARTLERAVFIAIIIFLTSLIIFKPAFIFWEGSPLKEAKKTDEVIGASVKTNNSTSSLEAEETEEEEEVAEEETVEQEETAEQEDSTPKLSGKIKLIVGVVGFEKKDVGGKITSVGFVVDNQKTAFSPLVKIYIFDENSGEVHKTSPRVIYEAETVLGAGKKLSKVVSVLAQFPDISLAKTVKLELYDSDTEELITEAAKVVVIT